ncbi:PSP1 domain-containing protein [Desulfotalea psychrophila]|uniref:PSP1 C-terminal domain-containing protein n=1 Tax=Desulfotalea psychrophila (strain LSv54 / DSM 12343) TaxID=177439 RepID=Q6AQ59_DESPS|nr:regulatory iron-sulfur-containing complex subunit RicT [Desulfotalea psychrophila]CAG35514.1 conserved hypothetical protein [Desulfotalea psychrophila LSv54]
MSAWDMTSKNDKFDKEEKRVESIGFGLICPAESSLYRIYFRDSGQQFTAFAMEDDLKRGDLVLVDQEQGPEPAVVAGIAPQNGCENIDRRVLYKIARRADSEEYEKYASLLLFENRAFSFCSKLVSKHKLKMCLVRVERFFNGSKMIFYFTAENRVDFRAMVKDLVQEFRTRVEMRQVGVRHETKMIGGIGTCGRELCCSSFIRKFDSVSIKMAKEQDLPLNPTKISGLCNRLLCCLTYEYDTYRQLRKKMPKVGRLITVGGQQYKVRRQNLMQNTLSVLNREGEEIILSKEEWAGCVTARGEGAGRGKREGKKTKEKADKSNDSKSEKKEK